LTLTLYGYTDAYFCTGWDITDPPGLIQPRVGIDTTLGEGDFEQDPHEGRPGRGGDADSS
jgi:hypothetical protein